MFKKSSRMFNIDRKTFNRSILRPDATFNTKSHSTVTYLVNPTEELTLNSGFVDESMNEIFKELAFSDEIYINDDGVVKPCYISDSQLAPLTSVNDKLINYTIKVKIAQSGINNIR